MSERNRSGGGYPAGILKGGEPDGSKSHPTDATATARKSDPPVLRAGLPLPDLQDRRRLVAETLHQIAEELLERHIAHRDILFELIETQRLLWRALFLG